jgi:hypothetical protein
MYIQVFGANAEFLKWAEDIITTANTRVMYPILSPLSVYLLD